MASKVVDVRNMDALCMEVTGAVKKAKGRPSKKNKAGSQPLQKSTESDRQCGSCPIPVIASDEAIQCYLFCNWWHIACTNVKKKDFKQFTNSEFKWCCKSCDQMFKKGHSRESLHVDDQFTAIKENISNLQKDLETANCLLKQQSVNQAEVIKTLQELREGIVQIAVSGISQAMCQPHKFVEDLEKVHSECVVSPLAAEINVKAALKTQKVVKAPVEKTKMDKTSITGGKELFQTFVIEEHAGDLFNAPPEYALAQCVDKSLEMKKGMSAVFESKFGRMNELRGKNKKVGEVAMLKGDRTIMYLITKDKYEDKANIVNFMKCVETLKTKCQENGVLKLAIPRLGMGKDQISWDLVKDILNQVFIDTAIKIRMYSLSSEFENVTNRSRKWDKLGIRRNNDVSIKQRKTHFMNTQNQGDEQFETTLKERQIPFRVIQDNKKNTSLDNNSMLWNKKNKNFVNKYNYVKPSPAEKCLNYKEVTSSSKMLLIGDSICKYAKEQNSWAAEDALIFPGIGIGQLRHMISKLDASKFPSNEVVLLHVGTNNVKTSWGPYYIGSEMRMLIKEVKGKFPTSKIVVGGILLREDVNDNIIYEANDAIQDICQAEGVVYANAGVWVGKVGISGDGIHLNRVGQYQIMSHYHEIGNTLIRRKGN